MTAATILKNVFGLSEFRDGQREIIDAILANRNVLAIMPTGSGKSLCFQVPAILRGGLTVVISPLIALMRDQVRALTSAGVAAGSLTSGNTDEETDRVYVALESGQLKLLYVAPERLANPATRLMLSKAGVGLIVVDEAHCVSLWGHDFRPDYLRIGDLARDLDVPLAAFTATADEETRQDIAARLFGAADADIFLRGFDRPNLHLAFSAKAKPREQALQFVEAHRGQSGIIYCGTRAKTETLAKALEAERHLALPYHAGMERDARRLAEERFQREDGLIICATVAFGMGIDKPDIRWVLHADLPKSVEAYYQEIGRAGRDGDPADTLTLFGSDDIRLRRSQIDEGLAEPARKGADHGRLNALLGLAEARECRRMELLAYFGETTTPCGNCDLCDEPAVVFDGTETVRMALSAVLRTGEWFGAGHLIDVLVGNASDKVRARGHDQLPTFGVGKNHGRADWQGIFRQMMGRDLLRPDSERYGALRLTPAARPILRGEQSIELRRDTIAAKPARAAAAALVSEEDEPLLAALKSKRRELAEAARAPAYVIFPDRTLIEMVVHRPETLDDFARLNGVGAKKLDRFGDIFLSVINASDANAVHPARRKLAGKSAGGIFDLLQQAQIELASGASGGEKPMHCTASTLAKVAKIRPKNLEGMVRLLGEKKTNRFGKVFLEILQDA